MPGNYCRWRWQPKLQRRTSTHLATHDSVRKHAQLHRTRLLKWNQTEAGSFEKAPSAPSLPPSPHTDSTRPLCTFSVFYLCRCFLFTVTCSSSTLPKDNFFYFKVENAIFHLRDFQGSSASYPLLPVGITRGAFVVCCPDCVSSQLSQKPAPHCTLFFYLLGPSGGDR